MGSQTGFRGHGVKLDVELAASVREKFWKEIGSGLSPTAAATVAGVAGATGRRWAKAAGYQVNSKHHGIRYSQQVRKQFWEVLRSGSTLAQAAVSAGVSDAAARRWIKQSGYVPRTPVPAGLEPDSVPRGRLSFVERCRLEELLEAGYTQARAADLLRRDPSTISREAGRGATSSGYRAQAGQDAADAAGARPKPRKLESNPGLLGEVVQRLTKRHSPEQIAGRLREDFPDDAEMWVSHETIYQSLFVQARGQFRRDLTVYLRSQRSRRQPRPSDGATKKISRIVGMISIRERPADVEDRAVPGHWEGDLIVGANNRSAIVTLVERSTRYVMLGRIGGRHDAETTCTVLTELIGRLPAHLRKTLTWDQGREMAGHAQFTIATDVAVYFCDPHSPWQRGSNENTNGLLRQYFPKGTNLAGFTQDELDAVASELNRRPRQTLNWMTPSEKLNELLVAPAA